MRRYWHYGAITLVLLLFAFIRFRLLDVPLERDEGEYGYMGQLILQGIPPYQLAYNMKLPGTYVAYAAMLAIFGQTPAAVHWGLICVNAATIVMMYLLGARLFGCIPGVVAGACYALLSAGQTVLGTAAHATHFVVFHALAGILVLLWALEGRRKSLLFLSGALLGLACLMKQPGIFFLLFAGVYLAFSELRNPAVERRGLVARAGAFLLGALSPIIVTFGVMLACGVFDRFWFWTFTYALAYGSTLGVPQGLNRLASEFPKVVEPSLSIWLIAAIGAASVLWSRQARTRAFFVSGFWLFSFLAVCPGFYFRPHYFVMLLPAAALLAGAAICELDRYLSGPAPRLRRIPAGLFALAFAFSVFHQREFFFRTDPVTACRQAYGASPFPESLEIARYLKAHASRDAKVAVLGSEPQIYFYSGLRSATGYLYTYSLMEPQAYALRMQEEMIAEIERASPEYLVYVKVPTSWTARPDSNRRIFDWADRYIAKGYVLAGLVEVAESGPSAFRWGEDAISYHPRSDFTLSILRRK